MKSEIISIENLVFAYRSLGFWPGSESRILDDISLSVRQGESFVLLGQNGAGKTTLIRILLGFVRNQGGRCRLFGLPVSDCAVRKRIGYLSEQPVTFPDLDSEAFLRFFGRLAGLEGASLEARIAALLDRTGLAPQANKPQRAFSKGMLQRLNLCRAMLHDPDLVILDEPIIGLDPSGQRLVRDLVLEWKAAGKTIFINTHAVDFARAVGDRIGFLRHGRLVQVIRQEELTMDRPPFQLVIERPSVTLPAEWQAKIDPHWGSEHTVAFCLPDAEAREKCLRWCCEHRMTVIALRSLYDPLEALFS